MNKNRKAEHFEQTKLKNIRTFTINPSRLFRQERDWSCAFACIRTLLSVNHSDIANEDSFIKKYSLTPKAYFSRDIKKLGILNENDAIFGCDISEEITFDYIIKLIQKGYGVMLESMINYSHWMVLLACYPLNGSNKEECSLVFFDPYYNEIRIMRLDEFETVWLDGDHESNGIKKDFIAIK